MQDGDDNCIHDSMWKYYIEDVALEAKSCDLYQVSKNDTIKAQILIQRQTSYAFKSLLLIEGQKIVSFPMKV